MLPLVSTKTSLTPPEGTGSEARRSRVRERQRARAAQKKADGICMRCTEPALPDCVHCEYHRVENALRAREYVRKQGVATTFYDGVPRRTPRRKQ